MFCRLLSFSVLILCAIPLDSAVIVPEYFSIHYLCSAFQPQMNAHPQQQQQQQQQQHQQRGPMMYTHQPMDGAVPLGSPGVRGPGGPNNIQQGQGPGQQGPQGSIMQPVPMGQHMGPQGQMMPNMMGMPGMLMPPPHHQMQFMQQGHYLSQEHQMLFRQQQQGAPMQGQGYMQGQQGVPMRVSNGQQGLQQNVMPMQINSMQQQQQQQQGQPQLYQQGPGIGHNKSNNPNINTPDSLVRTSL